MLIRPTALLSLLVLLACAEGERKPEIQTPPAGAVEAEPERPEPPRLASTALDTERSCLAMALYHEARGEGEEAMLAVGHAVLNRRDHDTFPETVCAVVKHGGETPPCQFSWWCDGRPDTPHNEELWERASALALELLQAEERDDPTGGALYFLAEGNLPPWAQGFTETHRAGGHVFLKE